MQSIGAAICASVRQKQLAAVSAIGYEGVSDAVVGLTWARRYLIHSGFDLDCFPCFSPVATTDGTDLVAVQILTKLTGKGIPPVKDPNQLSAVTRLGFATTASMLKTSEQAFKTLCAKELPTLRIANTTLPPGKASCAASYLRYFPGVQILCSGSTAVTIAFKMLAITRIYVREEAGYDLGFQCIHAPTKATDGNCQVKAWALLVKKEDPVESSEFRINNVTSAQDIGVACAHKLRSGVPVCFSAIGIGCVAKMFVALSVARYNGKKYGIDIVAFPKFDTHLIKDEDGTSRKTVSSKLELTSYNR